MKSRFIIILLSLLLLIAAAIVSSANLPIRSRIATKPKQYSGGSEAEGRKGVGREISHAENNVIIEAESNSRLYQSRLEPVSKQYLVPEAGVLHAENDINTEIEPKPRSFRPRPKPKPVAIVRSFFEPQPSGAFDYAFETENGIKQSATGTMKKVDDTEVVVMKGSYEYIGSDGIIYTVDWYADETGFHASAPHLPKPVVIPFPEQAKAVDAQVRFAENQRNLRIKNRSKQPKSNYGVVTTPTSESGLVSDEDTLQTYNSF